MDRQHFLSEVWKPYPTVPDGAQFGRVVGILDGSIIFENDVSFEAIGDLSVLRPGDWIAIDSEGYFTLLAPALKPLKKSLIPADLLRTWSDFKDEIRQELKRKSFIEVVTPTLVACPGTEPSLDVFVTVLSFGNNHETRYLPTSPELHLKKALARGLPKIFEMKTCYRNGEVTLHHQPEFTMLEWYRVAEKPDAIMRDVRELITVCAQKFKQPEPKNIETISMAELFRTKLGVTITPKSNIEDYRQIATKLGLSFKREYSIDDLFFLIFIEKIEPTFVKETLTFVTDWPPFQAALARLTPEGWGDRFEVYWQGLELANAFHELNDPEVQRQRFQADISKKIASGRKAVPLDEDFLHHLDAGLPPASGIALGVERLFMAMFGIYSIAELSLFPELR